MPLSPSERPRWGRTLNNDHPVGLRSTAGYLQLGSAKVVAATSRSGAAGRGECSCSHGTRARSDPSGVVPTAQGVALGAEVAPWPPALQGPFAWPIATHEVSHHGPASGEFLYPSAGLPSKRHGPRAGSLLRRLPTGKTVVERQSVTFHPEDVPDRLARGLCGCYAARGPARLRLECPNNNSSSARPGRGDGLWPRVKRPPGNAGRSAGKPWQRLDRPGSTDGISRLAGLAA